MTATITSSVERWAGYTDEIVTVPALRVGNDVAWWVTLRAFSSQDRFDVFIEGVRVGSYTDRESAERRVLRAISQATEQAGA